MTTRQQIIDEARTWLGTPWHHRARVKGAGVDCVMLLCEVYETTGAIPHVEPEYYPIDVMMHRDGEHVIAWLERFGSLVEVPQPADVVIFRFGRSFSHAGIIADTDLNVIHAFRSYNMVVETRIDEHLLAGRERRFYAFRGLA